MLWTISLRCHTLQLGCAGQVTMGEEGCKIAYHSTGDTGRGGLQYTAFHFFNR